jgi:hypothetical protein
VVYVSTEMETQAKPMDLPILLDPTLLRSAKRIYRTYCVINPKVNKRPLGVAIHRDSYRGQLIFNAKPILLPGEYFVPVKQLEGEFY